MRALFLILVFGCVSHFVWIRAQKTVTISSPSCNLNTVIEVPTSQCCCPTIAPPKPTLPPSPNIIGCPTRLKYRPPTCVKAGSVMYRGSECFSYYICTGPNHYNEKNCTGKLFSELRQACVDPPASFKLCCVW